MDKSKWFFLESVRPEATAWLICFPYSGAGPSFFAPWAAELPAAFNLTLAEKGEKHGTSFL